MAKPHIFLSYSRRDSRRAGSLERGLNANGLPVWRDIGRIEAGQKWAEAIEAGVRNARAAIVLIPASGEASDWVLYEYGLATGAGVPVIAVVNRGGAVPDPIKLQFQTIEYTNTHEVVQKIGKGLSVQSRALGEKRAMSAPMLFAKFKERNGEPKTASKGKTPEYHIETWLEQTPKQTKTVAFEIMDGGFEDPKWTEKRSTENSGVHRDFLCKDMRSFGDIEIWAQGRGAGVGNWTGSWRLYEALMRYYRSRSISAGVRAALKQIRVN